LTQVQLGGLVGRSEAWVSSVERGRRQVRRLDVLVEVARELRVDLPDLLGRPVLEEWTVPGLVDTRTGCLILQERYDGFDT
jgi:transcriptional regulator with XRE-family HTH domain